MTTEQTALLGELLITDFDGAWGDQPNRDPGIPVIRSTDMRGGKLNLQSAERRVIAPQVLIRKRLVDGDILVTKSSGSAHLVGASVLFVGSEGKNYVCSNFTRCLRPNMEKVIPEYLYFGIQSPQFKEQVFGAQRTTSGLRNLKIDEFKSGSIFLPSLEEQRRIVRRIEECFSRVEEIEALRTATLAEANAILPSFLNSEFVKLGEAYASEEIGALAVETRYGTSFKCSVNPIGTAILRIPNVAGGFVNFNNLKYCQLGELEIERLVLQSGDLLFVRTNGSRELVGRCAIFDGDSENTYAFASYLIRVRLAEERMRSHFLSFFLNSTQGRTELDKRRRTSAGQFNINSENLRSIEVPVPPLDIQDEVIEKMRGHQNLAITLQESLTSVTADNSCLRESILRKAFAGEL